jgi:PEP-CTERM motif
LEIWGNSASSSVNAIEGFNESTGALLNQFVGNPGGNGRGVVVIGNTLYYTRVGDGTIHELDATTGAPLAANIPTGQASLATIAYDPIDKGFWLGDYSGTNHAYFYDLSKNMITSTITLANCRGNCDGLEFFIDKSGNKRLISNEYDGGFGGANTYDVYDTSGNLITAGFIVGHNTSGNTGIAYDGTDFFISNIFANSLSEYDSNGVYIGDITLGGPLPPNGRLIEDLSFNYSIVIPTPEPGSLALLGAALVGLAGIRRRRAAK